MYFLLLLDAQLSLHVCCKLNCMLNFFACVLQLSQEAERLRRSQAEASSSIDAENLLGAAAEAVRSVSDDIVARRLSSTEAGTSGFDVRVYWPTSFSCIQSSRWCLHPFRCLAAPS